MRTALAKKLGAITASRAYFLDAPAPIAKAIAGSELLVSARLAGQFDYVHAFVLTQQQLAKALPRLREHLAPHGKLWISWPKNRQLDTDLTLMQIIRIGYDHNLVESKTIGIDATWSAIKFTFPKAGKRYNNSYGQLPSADRSS